MRIARAHAFAFVLAAGCGGRVSERPLELEPEVEETCDSRVLFEGKCPGVPLEPICASSACTGGVACTSVLSATSSTELANAAATAPPGSCIVLSPGRYVDVTLPSSVSLLGSGARFVKLDGVRSLGGPATLRGLEIAGVGLRIAGGGLVTVDRVRVRGSDGRGIHATEASLLVRRSTIESTEAGGIEHVACGTTVATPPNLALHGVRVRSTQGIGVRACGVLVDLRGVLVTDTRPKQFLLGRGLHLQQSIVIATATMVDGSAEAGIVLDRSGGRLGPDLIVMRSMPGVAVLEPNADRILLRGFELRDNRAVSISIQRAKTGVTLEEGSIVGTLAAKFPTGVGSLFESGDGIDALSFSSVVVAASVKITGSARRAAVIDGSVTGSFDAKLSGEDATRGIVVQAVDARLPEGPSIALGIPVERRARKDALPVLTIASAP